MLPEPPPHEPPPPPANPYVGPRAFVENEKLFGRERERRELFDLLVAERIVLLHAPSGAGKTSLIQAALVPKLKDESFVVRRIVRVNTELSPAAASGLGPFNRYVLSTLLSLEEDTPKERRRGLKELAGMTLCDYLSPGPAAPAAPAGGAPRRELSAEELSRLSSKEVIKYLALHQKAREGRDVEVLILDQFEEVLTLDPTDVGQKHEFFRQLGEALRDRHRWALFSMREDYVAPLDPYLDWLPTRLATNYRLDLLDINSAHRAIEKPAEERFADSAAGGGRRVYFSNTAVKTLVEDLRSVFVQRIDGDVEEAKGPYVEPVHLQVVCRRLWAETVKRRWACEDGDLVIGQEDIRTGGEVSKALADYYAETVAEIAAESNPEWPGSKERQIRDWFEKNLITEQRLRGQVLQSAQVSHGLDNRIIRKLVDAFIVREERRRGAVWFELAHDRLVEPVRMNNAEWRDANLQPFQRKAESWKKNDRHPSLLLTEEELAEAEAWEAGRRDELTPGERRYLDDSRKLRETLVLERKQLWAQRRRRKQRVRDRERQERARRNRIAIILLSVALAVAAVATPTAIVFYMKANKRFKVADVAADISISRKLSAESFRTADSNPELSILLALESVSKMYPKHRDLIEKSGGVCVEEEEGGPPEAGGGGADEQAADGVEHRVDDLTQAGCDARAALFQARDILKQRLLALQVIHTVPSSNVKSLAYMPDGNEVVVASPGGELSFVNSIGGQSYSKNYSPVAAATSAPGQPSPRPLAFAFDTEGQTCVTGRDDGFLIAGGLKNISTSRPTATRVHDGGVTAVAYDPRGEYVATAGDDGTVKVWEARNLFKLAPGAQTPAGPAANAAVPYRVFRADFEKVKAVALSAGGAYLAAAGQEKDKALSRVRLWSAREGREVFPQQTGGDRTPAEQGEEASRRKGRPPDDIWNVNALAFGPGASPLLVTGGEDGVARLWFARNFTPVKALAHGGAINAVAFSRDGRLLATGGQDHDVKVWAMNDDRIQEFTTLRGHQGAVRALDFSPGGDHLVSFGDDVKLRVWGMKGNFGRVSDAAFAGDANVLVSLTEQGAIVLNDIDSDGQEGVVGYLGGGGEDDIPEEEEDDAPSAGKWERPSLVVNKARKILFAADGEAITGWDYSRELDSIQLFHINTGPLRGFDVSPNGLRLATVRVNGDVEMWNRVSNKRLETPFKATGQAVAFGQGPQGESHLLAIANQRGDVRIWEVESDNDGGGGDAGAADKYTEVCSELRLRASREAPELHGVGKLVFSPDGAYLAEADTTHDSVTIWDVKGCVESQTLERGRGGETLDLAFSPDGKLLALAGRDVKVFRLSDKRREFTFEKGEAEGMRSVAFSPDGKNLVSVTERGEQHVHFLGETEELMAQLRRRLPRAWTEEECSFYLQELRDQQSRRKCEDKIRALAVILDASRLARASAFATDAPLPPSRIEKLDKAEAPAAGVTPTPGEVAVGAGCDDFVPASLPGSKWLNRAIESFKSFKVSKADGEGGDAETVYEALKFTRVGERMCPQAEALALSKEGDLEAARNLVVANDWDGAASFYLRLRNPAELLEGSRVLVRNGKVAEAVNAFDDVRASMSAEPGSAGYNDLLKFENEICWYGSWWGGATERVKKLCDEAVKLNKDPNLDLVYRDSLGVALARLWQETRDDAARAEAAATFERLAKETSDVLTAAEKKDRGKWALALTNQKCIFDPETIRAQLGLKDPGPQASRQERNDYRKKFELAQRASCPN
ncbi:MAG TPA: hypothetical protein VF668_19225 [Pyrinomonadaceae bacterium]|jgi:WD40 repeat protein